jgi:hypothetical protein
MKRTGISSEAVKAKTGKGWDDWFAVLDKDEADKLDHKEIAKLLITKHNISAWWAQMVTVGYERARGIRKVHETKQGFVASVSRTMHVNREELYKMLESPARNKWIKIMHEEASSNPPKSLRIKFDDGSRVEFGILDKGSKKSSISAQHFRLKNEEEVQEKKALWLNALDTLKKLVEAE